MLNTYYRSRFLVTTIFMIINCRQQNQEQNEMSFYKM